MNKAVIIAILAVMVAGCAGREEMGRASYQESPGDAGYIQPSEPNFPTGVPGTGIPESAPGGIR
jgi:hypothetical protein